jgi:hypothetical protein
MAAELRLLGFERIGPLAAAARAPLARRFGPLQLTRLDQMAGRVFEPIIPVVPEERIQARLAFVEPLLTVTPVISRRPFSVTVPVKPGATAWWNWRTTDQMANTYWRHCLARFARGRSGIQAGY